MCASSVHPKIATESWFFNSRYDQKGCCSSAGVKDECLSLCRFNASISGMVDDSFSFSQLCGLPYQINHRIVQAWHKPYREPHPQKRKKTSQLSNLWWMPNSVGKGFDTAMKRGSSNDSNDTPKTYTVEPCILEQIEHLWGPAMTKPMILLTKSSNMTLGRYIGLHNIQKSAS